MKQQPEEIGRIIKEQILHYEDRIEMVETGTVILVGDGIARVYGLRGCMAGELLEFDGGSFGMAQNLEEETVSVAILSDKSDIREGTAVHRTGRVVSVPVGDALLGRKPCRNGFVAGKLQILVRLLCHNPNQRIEPVHRHGEHQQHFVGYVMAFVVNKLVADYHFKLLFGIVLPWQKQHRLEKSRDHGAFYPGANRKGKANSGAHFPRTAFKNPASRFVFRRRCPTAHMAKELCIAGELNAEVYHSSRRPNYREQLRRAYFGFQFAACGCRGLFGCRLRSRNFRCRLLHRSISSGFSLRVLKVLLWNFLRHELVLKCVLILIELHAKATLRVFAVQFYRRVRNMNIKRDYKPYRQGKPKPIAPFSAIFFADERQKGKNSKQQK